MGQFLECPFLIGKFSQNLQKCHLFDGLVIEIVCKTYQETRSRDMLLGHVIATESKCIHTQGKVT